MLPLSMFHIAATFLLLSGIASLTYQVVWVRLLGLSMGSTSASISTVLAAFFLGLALGSYLAERITRNRINSLTPYVVLEMIIGASGLALLPVLLNLDAIVAAYPALGSSIPSKFVLTMMLLTIPTLCMGATFPVMASILIRRQAEVGVRVSQLYSLNTAGAVLGAALGGFVFIPTWGLDGAIYIAFSINLIIVLSGWLLNRRLILPPVEQDSAPADASGIAAPSTQARSVRSRALVILFATGLVSIATEVGWTKYLSIFTGTTIYGFAAILTIFLIGIAAGSWWIRTRLASIDRPELWMAAGLALLAGSLLLTRAGLTMIPAVYEAVNHFPVSAWLRSAVKYTIVFALLFPPTFLFGALFPLNLRLYCGNLQGVRARIGKAYAVNTVASIFGSLLAGFWIIPEYGTDSLLTVMALLLLLLPLVFLPSITGASGRAAVTALVLLVLGSNWVLPHLSYESLIASVQYDDQAYLGEQPEFLFLKEGKAGVISMVTYDNRRVKLQNNGLNESFIDLEDDNNVLLVESLLGLVPYMMHEDPKSAFVVGFGGGITTKALTLTQIDTIRVVELEPAVVEAGKAIRGGTIPFLEDPRVRLDFNDARNTLLTDKTMYDIIAAQPSHPWLARASGVFTQEFFELVRSRLNEDGIYAQWVNLFRMDTTTLRSLMHAFYLVFPHGFTMANLESGDFVMIGSRSELRFDYKRMSARMAEPEISAALAFHKVKNFNDLMWYFALSREQALQASRDIAPNTDTNILSEVRLSTLDRHPVGEESPYEFLGTQYSLNIEPYLGADASDRIYDMAVYYLNDYYYEDMVGFLADQLRERDPVRARGIEHEVLLRRLDFEKASELYVSETAWPDRNHVRQALAFAEAGLVREAFDLVDRVEDAAAQEVLYLRLLFGSGRFAEMLARDARHDKAEMWRLTALARNDLYTAGAGLAALAERLDMDLPQLRVLVAYHSQLGNFERADFYARRILALNDQEVKRVTALVVEAVDSGDEPAASRRMQRIDALNPPDDDGELAVLRKKIQALK